MRKLKSLNHVFSRILWKGTISVFAIGTLTLILNFFLFSNLQAEVFKTTAYCSCEKCCGKDPSDDWYGITATGTKAQWGTVAVDRKLIKLGSKLRIDGFPDITFRAEDVGGAIKGNHIDIWFPSHEEALEYGVHKKVIYLVE
jgi:3D (Asp-Asp-Asp) domain-containing protein